MEYLSLAVNSGVAASRTTRYLSFIFENSGERREEGTEGGQAQEKEERERGGGGGGGELQNPI